MNRLATLLRHVIETVPYYANLGVTLGPTPSLADFPVIGKREYVAHLDELLSSEYADHERSTSARDAAGRKVLIWEFTSGSSGYPLRCYKTVAERTQLAISLMRKRKAMDPTFTPDQLFGFIHNHDYPATSHHDGLGNLSDDNIERVLVHLRDRRRPPFLHGNPMLLLYYADFIARTGFDLGDWKIRFIESVSESLTPADRREVEARFGTRVANCYGCLECYNIAYECRQGKLHTNEHVVIEILDAATGADLTASSEMGEVVLTSLVNHAQPFVRYRTGDLARLLPPGCDCGSAQPVLALSGQRKIDFIKLLFSTTDTQLRICGYDLFAAAMYRLVAAGADWVQWYNVVQVALDRFQVLYVPKPGFSERFFELFQRESEEELGAPAHFEFIAQDPAEVLLINRKNRVFKSLLQGD